MKKYVCLRDDDTNFNTQVDDLLGAYEEIWGKIPITLGVVPFSHGSQKKMLDFETENNRFRALREWEKTASSEELASYHKLHPISDNIELTAELTKQQRDGKIEIAQHGVSHRYNEFGAETNINQITLPMIRDGKEYLDKVFGKSIETFIPPSNSIDSECAKYVKELGMFLLSSGSINYSHFKEKAEALFYHVYEKAKFGQYKPIRKRVGQYIVSSFTFGTGKSKDEIFSLVSESLEKTGFAAIGTHYMVINRNNDDSLHKEYMDLINQILSIENVEFLLAKDYKLLLEEKYYNK